MKLNNKNKTDTHLLCICYLFVICFNALALHTLMIEVRKHFISDDTLGQKLKHDCTKVGGVVNYHEYNFVLHSYKYMLLNVNIHVCLSVLKLVYM